jgi:hypothetical protein
MNKLRTIGVWILQVFTRGSVRNSGNCQTQRLTGVGVQNSGMGLP